MSSPSRFDLWKPKAALARSCAPALVVMIRITLRKSICFARVVGQLAVVHDLQQDVEQIGMGLLDLVEQQNAVGMLVDRVGQQAALVEADIAGRRADQARDRMALHIFRHVEADQLESQAERRAGARPRSCRRRSGRRTGSSRSASRGRASRRGRA